MEICAIMDYFAFIKDGEVTMKQNKNDNRQLLLDLAKTYCDREGKHSTPLPQLHVIRRDSRTEAIPGKYTSLVCLVLQGEKKVWSGKNVFRYNPDQYLVSCVDAPAIFQVTNASPRQPYIGLTLELQPSIVYEILHDSSMPESSSNDSNGGFFVEKVTAELAEAFARLMRSIENKDELKLLAPSIVREIHFRLMRSRYGAKISNWGSWEVKRSGSQK